MLVYTRLSARGQVWINGDSSPMESLGIRLYRGKFVFAAIALQGS